MVQVLTNSHFLIFGSQLLGPRPAGSEFLFCVLIRFLQTIKLGLCFDRKMSISIDKCTPQTGYVLYTNSTTCIHPYAWAVIEKISLLYKSGHIYLSLCKDISCYDLDTVLLHVRQVRLANCWHVIQDDPGASLANHTYAQSNTHLITHTQHTQTCMQGTYCTLNIVICTYWEDTCTRVPLHTYIADTFCHACTACTQIPIVWHNWNLNLSSVAQQWPSISSYSLLFLLTLSTLSAWDSYTWPLTNWS